MFGAPKEFEGTQQCQLRINLKDQVEFHYPSLSACKELSKEGAPLSRFLQIITMVLGV